MRSSGAALRAAATRWQFWLLLAALGILVGMIGQLVDTEDTTRYELTNTSLTGYAAMASVLEDQGVTIHRVYSAEMLREHLSEDPSAAVVVFERGPAAGSQLVEELAGSDGDVIWLAPSTATRNVISEDELRRGGPIPTSRTTEVPVVLESTEQCSHPAAQAAESIQTEGWLYTGGQGCFTHTDSETDDQAHALVVTESGVVFHSPEAFTNQHITTAGHAALALGLFGQESDLIWYTPSQMDSISEDEWASPWDFLPQWVAPLTWWLLICTAIFILVAGRRRGPVVVEPLPVEVPASESAEGRARLYQQADASRAAAQTLRSAHLIRLAHLLRLGSSAGEGEVFGAVARHTGRAVEDIARLFDTGRVSGNAGMVRFSQELAVVEDDVRIRLGHGPRRRTNETQSDDETSREETP